MRKIWMLGLKATILGLALASAAKAASPSTHESLIYRGSFVGVDVLELQAAVDMRPEGYKMLIDFHTRGAIDFLMHSQAKLQVDGIFQAGRPTPTHFASAGVLKGKPNHVEISYPDGQPHVDVLDPVIDSEHEPIPPALQRNTMDGMSALVDLLQAVTNSGKCDGEVMSFDGRRLSRIVVTSGGRENVPDEGGLIYHGPALRCDITNTLLAGFPTDSSPNDLLRQPRHSKAWFAPLQPGGPPVAVFIQAELHVVGHLNLTLVGAAP